MFFKRFFVVVILGKSCLGYLYLFLFRPNYPFAPYKLENIGAHNISQIFSFTPTIWISPNKLNNQLYTVTYEFLSQFLAILQSYSKLNLC